MQRSLLVVVAALVTAGSAPQPAALPAGPLVFGAFAGQFRPDGTFSISGEGWPTLAGGWKIDGSRIELLLTSPPRGCEGAGRYDITVADARVTFTVIADSCTPRRMILDRSTWRPADVREPVETRPLRLTAYSGLPPLPRPADRRGSWPSFRGLEAAGVADGQRLPDRWDVTTGENILWRTPIPGLAHSSPVVWGDRIFVTTAVSSDPAATFRPGLYGDGDAAEDRSRQRWIVYAIDKRTGRIAWERVADEGPPRNKRHIKSTYASATPATDGRIVVAWFGSQGLYAYDIDGTLRWKVDLGRVDMGAYDIPTYEWGPASSPIIWNGLVILQCDTQADSFIVAFDAETGRTVWRTGRDELPSWGTPTVVTTPRGPELVTNAARFVRGYDPRTGKERWRLGGSSKITAPTPIAGGGLFVVTSGRAPERPVFVVRPGAQGDITPAAGATTSSGVAWSRTGRGSYMPTPLIYNGLLYMLANNGVFDAYALESGEEIYRQRMPHPGSGFSASPIAADGKIYAFGEDGEITVIAAGKTFRHITTIEMGEPLMATPALSDGVMFVRSARSLFAIGQR